MQKEIKEEKEYIDGIKIELFGRGVVAFTPKGYVFEMPQGSTVLDFAFALHTEIGLNADKIKVNGKIVPFNQEVHDGDVIEVITAPVRRVNVNWLGIVKTSKAKSKIRVALNMAGKIKKAKIEKEISDEEAKKAYIENGELIAFVHSPNIKIAKCCNPTVNDEIITYPPKEKKYTIHKKDCKIFKQSPEYKRMIPARWGETKGIYIQKLNVISEDRPGLLSEIIKQLMKNQVNLQKINVSSTKDDRVMINLVIKYLSDKQIEAVKTGLKNINGIKEVYMIM
jgi:GTP pyrophosphokinase